MLLVVLTKTISPADINGRLVIKESANSKLSVLVQINTNTGSEALGGATMVLVFDTASLSFNSVPEANQDYIFHNFSDNNYSAGTVTHPLSGRIWINIDLPISQSNNGNLVSDIFNWTDLVTLSLNVTNHSAYSDIFWFTDSPYWGIYGDDNITIWNTGHFQHLENFSPLTGLSSFTGKLINNNQVLLSWKMINDNSLFGFDIEKSAGINSDSQWERIGFVEDPGNLNTNVEYSFTDLTPHYTQLIKYRLKIIDIDGSFNYSNVIEVDIGQVSFELMQNFPNPFNPATVIGYQLSVAGIVNLKVYDLLGNEIATLADEFREAGYHTVNFNAAGLASGVYFYRLIAGGPSTDSGHSFVDTKKMILLR